MTPLTVRVARCRSTTPATTDHTPAIMGSRLQQQGLSLSTELYSVDKGRGSSTPEPPIAGVQLLQQRGRSCNNTAHSCNNGIAPATMGVGGRIPGQKASPYPAINVPERGRPSVKRKHATDSALARWSSRSVRNGIVVFGDAFCGHRDAGAYSRRPQRRISRAELPTSSSNSPASVTHRPEASS